MWSTGAAGGNAASMDTASTSVDTAAAVGVIAAADAAAVAVIAAAAVDIVAAHCTTRSRLVELVISSLLRRRLARAHAVI